MAIYLKKRKEEILRQALSKLENDTPIKATSPGSIARAFTEAVSDELGDFYDVLDYNLGQSLVSSASGSSLDLLGELYGVKRKTVTDLAETDRKVGSFYFYIDTPLGTELVIPKGTRVYTSVDSYVGRQLGYETTNIATIPAGRTKAYAGLKPIFGEGFFSAGIDSLVQHDATSPPGTRIKCTNPKKIAPQTGYEGDDNYRLRITKSIRVAASGTLEAIRFAGLGVNGVRDIKIRQAPYGLGSFEVVVTSEEANAARTVMPVVTAMLERVRPVGVRMYLKQPALQPTDVSATLILKGTLTDRAKANIAARAKVGVLRYLNSLLSGETLVYNKLMQSILDSSESIVDVQITRYAPNGVEVIRKNFIPKEDEQVIPGRIDISLA